MKQSTLLTLMSQFTPPRLFRAGQAGLWADPSDLDTQKQDSAGTTAAAVDQPIGLANDKSGRANHLLQATADSRPALKLDGPTYSWLFDGTADSLATASFSAGTLTAGMDCFIAVKRSSLAKAVLVMSDNTAKFFAYFADEPGAASQSAGTALTHFVDGVAVPGGTSTTCAQLHAALTVGPWHILEIRGLDLSAWTACGISNYPSVALTGSVGGVVICPAQTDSVRNQIRRWLGRKVGI